MAQNDSSPTAASSDLVVNIKQIQTDMTPLDLSSDFVPPASIASYLSYYGIGTSQMRFFFGSFNSQGHQVCGQVFLPQDPKGTLFLLHGYLDHAASFNNLVQAAIARRYAVAVFDLPGHGLSSGERGAIDDFKSYVKTFKDFINLCAPELPQPFHIVGHSTGCAIAFEYLQETHEEVFDKIVFLAPLVHNANWRMSKFGIAIAKPFVDTLPRKYRANSSDTEFLDFVRKDPLQGRRLSIQFLNALHAWDARAQRYDPVSQSVLLIQGVEDKIVDWQYNIAFLKAKIKGVTVELIDDARHQLANENEEIRSHVFDMVFEFLGRQIIFWDRPDIA